MPGAWSDSPFPLSIVMTVCTTLGAVALPPLLTKILAGTYIPVDAAKLSISTTQADLSLMALAQTVLSGEIWGGYSFCAVSTHCWFLCGPHGV
ncbi:hypothetical protein GBA52_021989 [Prunus armeniaca]|nr:hypothetical protein GBA52_021989 [Prunus armeniaca]